MVSVNLIPMHRRIARARGRRIRRWLFASSITTFFLVVVGAAEGVSRANLAQAQRRHEGLQKLLGSTRANLKSIPQGAATQVYLAAHPDGANTSGRYYSDCNEAEAIDIAFDDALAEKLWTWTETVVVAS